MDSVKENKQNGLVAINPRVSRRNFLKIAGTTSAVGLAGCAEDQAQKIFPFVKGEVEQIPGVAVWYNSTCGECTAGCGIQVRTREGRAVKIEGNPENPINRGGLCALGQASLQGLYDPDRVRQPLKRVSGIGSSAVFEPVTWDEAITTISTALKAELKPGQGRAFITGEISGAQKELITEWSEKFAVQHAAYDPLQPIALAKACELTYGVYGVPEYAFDKAEVVLNFGADFLETWVSPCQFARDWATSRKSNKPVRVVHIEPRLSLTGANADLWLMAKPGTEIFMAQAILKLLLDAGRGSNLAADVKKSLVDLVKDVNVGAAAARCEVSEEKIVLVAHYLAQAKNSLVIGGGTAASSSNAVALFVLLNFINSVLENVNVTVNLSRMRVPETSVTKVTTLIKDMQEGKVGALFVHGANPAFSLPTDYGFEVAARSVPLMVSFSSQLDETARNAHYVLPAHTSLESWGDVRVYEGNYGLQQPVMTPVFSTRSLGDQLVQLASAAGAPIVGTKIPGRASDFKPKDFREFLEESWKSLHRQQKIAQAFPAFWKESVERGGYYASSAGDSLERVKVRVDRQVFAGEFAAASFVASYPTERVKKESVADKDTFGGKDMVLFPYASVKTFDGRAANRPWLQEIGDPITQIVWDSWAELHPDTAKELKVEQGDMLAVRNYFGEINVPVLISNFVRPEVVAVPLGQGHTSFGRFAAKVGGGSVYTLLSSDARKDTAGDGLGLLSATVKVARGKGRADVVNLQGSDSQQARDIARTSYIKENEAGKLVAERQEAEVHDHEVKQMYKQREHPLYEWGMTVDLAACTGCSACVVACYAENNIPVVGKKRCSEGREMSWIRIQRYFDNQTATNKGEVVQPEELTVSFLPMMCQHCHNAPCEPVCPVYATYHNEEGMNAMIYNRCVGTRYCSNNCTYKVRRFNWYDYEVPEPLTWQLNPDVTKRIVGIMEKCTFCVQRIVEAKDIAKDEGRTVRDGDVKPACVQSCPTQALTFGNLKDMQSKVSKDRSSPRSYKVLDYTINTQPAVTYLERVKYEKA